MNKQKQQGTDQEFLERVVTINRVTKVVKGGRRFAFSALVVAGDGKGQVGIGKGKASEVPESINKAGRVAKKAFMKVPLKNQRTIPHEIIGKFGASQVVLRPAGPGTGVIAGGPVRAVLECIGVRDILTKRMGSRNPHNVVNATLNGLRKIKEIREKQQMRPAGRYIKPSPEGHEVTKKVQQVTKTPQTKATKTEKQPKPSPEGQQMTKQTKPVANKETRA